MNVFYAEGAWDHVQHLELSALAMENYLGQIADMIIIIVESIGTAAELGAFALSDELRPKIFAILDAEFAHHASFINTGPVKWLDADSQFKPAFVHFEPNFTAITELEERLAPLAKAFRGLHKGTLTSILPGSDKNILFLLCHLATIIGPAASMDFCYIIEQIKPGFDHWRTASLLGLAHSLGLLVSDGEGAAKKYRRSPNTALRLSNTLRINMDRARARFLDARLGSESKQQRRQPGGAV